MKSVLGQCRRPQAALGAAGGGVEEAVFACGDVLDLERGAHRARVGVGSPGAAAQGECGCRPQRLRATAPGEHRLGPGGRVRQDFGEAIADDQEEDAAVGEVAAVGVSVDRVEVPGPAVDEAVVHLALDLGPAVALARRDGAVQAAAHGGHRSPVASHSVAKSMPRR